MLRVKIALWAIWTLLGPFLRLTVTWLKIYLDEIVDETFIVRLSVISWSKARFDPCKITKTSSRSSEAVSHKTSLRRPKGLIYCQKAIKKVLFCQKIVRFNTYFLTEKIPSKKGVQTCANLTFADCTFADGHLLPRHSD